jgi:hypothetical protein
MLSSTAGPDLSAPLIFGAGAAVLGVALLFGKPTTSRRWRLVLGLAVFLAGGLATWVPLLDDLSGARWPMLALAATCAALLSFSTTYPRRVIGAAMTLAAKPRAQGVALVAAGALLVGVVPWLLEREATQALRTKAVHPYDPVSAEMHQKKVTAWTDRGNPIDVFDLGGHVALVDDRAAEAEFTQSRDLGLHLIRTAPPDGGSNCHGWVFTGGHYLVDGGDVDHILQDNGYDVVTRPRVGDLVIYRLGAGSAAHSAVVRLADDDGLVLLESKWNTLGRYLHAPEAYAARATWTYYRSPRSGHLLRMEPTTAAPEETPPPEADTPDECTPGDASP